MDGFELDCASAFALLDSGAATFTSWATVRVTYTSGRTQTFTGQTTLPPGIDVRFTGQMAHAANFAFGAGMIVGGFNMGVYWAIGSGFAAQANPADGRAGSVAGGFASFFLPQQTPQNNEQQRTLVPTEDINAYRARIETMLKEKRCRDFIDKLLNEVKGRTGRSYKGLVDAFNDITFYYARTGAHGGSATFEHGNRVAYIENTINTEKFTSEDRSAFLIGNTVRNIVGETLHHIDGSGPYSMFDDADYARAYNAIRVREGTDILRNFSSETSAGADMASNYWHSSVDKHCTYPRK
jgi:hypothetical protein